jgi:hypothetical protein
MVKLFKSEPAAILGAVQAIVALVVAFGLSLSPEQIGSIMAAVAAVVAVVVRSQVSPAASVLVDPTPTASQPAAPSTPPVTS